MYFGLALLKSADHARCKLPCPENAQNASFYAAEPRAFSVFELARIMGTSVTMIERVYGTLIEGAGLGIVSRLDAFNAAPERNDQDERPADV